VRDEINPPMVYDENMNLLGRNLDAKKFGKVQYIAFRFGFEDGDQTYSQVAFYRGGNLVASITSEDDTQSKKM